MRHLRWLACLLVLLIASCGTPANTSTNKENTSTPTTTVPKTQTTDVSDATQEERDNKNVSNNSGQTTDSSTTITQTKSTASAPSASLSASFVSPSPYAWVANQALNVSWTVKNTTQRDVDFNLVLTDLTDSRITYKQDLNINSNFPSARLQNGIYSWTIPATYISSQGYTLQDKHQYKLSLHTHVKWNGPGICPYKAVDCSTQFSVDSSKFNLPAPTGKLGVSMSFKQAAPQDGKWFNFKVTVTAGGKPLPDAIVTVDMHSSTQSYAQQNLITQVDGTTDFSGGIFDNNPLIANVTVKAIGQVVTASGTYTLK